MKFVVRFWGPFWDPFWDPFWVQKVSAKGPKTEPTMRRCIDFGSGWTICSTLLPCMEKSR